MARYGCGNHYGMSANVGGSAADAGVSDGGFDNEIPAQADGACELRDGCTHWAVDDVFLASAGDVGL